MKGAETIKCLAKSYIGLCFTQTLHLCQNGMMTTEKMFVTLPYAITISREHANIPIICLKLFSSVDKNQWNQYGERLRAA